MPSAISLLRLSSMLRPGSFAKWTMSTVAWGNVCERMPLISFSVSGGTGSTGGREMKAHRMRRAFPASSYSRASRRAYFALTAS